MCGIVIDAWWVDQPEFKIDPANVTYLGVTTERERVTWCIGTSRIWAARRTEGYRTQDESYILYPERGHFPSGDGRLGLP